MVSELAAALAAWPIAGWIRTSPFAYPLLEVVHLWALAAVFGSILVVDLRLVGLRMQGLDRLPLDRLGRAILPWTLSAFALAAMSGSLMFVSRAPDFVTNPAFMVKIALLAAAGVNAAWLHARGGLADADARANRVQGWLSMGLWLGIIAAGRWIAYA